MKEVLRISGVVEEVVYYNPKNDYTVIEIETEDHDRVTAVGCAPGIAEGEEIELGGSWVHHAEYGRQFSFVSCSRQLPSGVGAMLRYLSSRVIRGVGPVTASKIIARFGEESFDVMENHSEWLADIPGISPKKANEIGEAFREQTGIRSVMMFCRDYVGSSAVGKIYKRWGAASVSMIKTNPYCLCSAGFGIGFERADKLALDLNFSVDSPLRIRSGIKYILDHNAHNNGHVCLPEDKLRAAAAVELGVEESQVADEIAAGIDCGEFYVRVKEGQKFIYTARNFAAEQYVAKKLVAMSRSCPCLGVDDCARIISAIEAECGIEYGEMQRRAIYEAVNGGVFVLSGGPGTGKTTVARALIRIFEHIGYRVALAAPTGRAAKRMSEATSHEAKTIHRLLETERTDGEEGKFNRYEDNPIDEDVIIVDETSMMDIYLAEALLRAIKRGGRLVLIGDADQLPSVGAGNVFSDILASGAFGSVVLQEIFRQSAESAIITNAHRINRGEAIDLSLKDSDFFYLSRESEYDIAETVVSLVTVRLPRTYGDDIKSRIQIISPSKKGRAGTVNLNVMLQARLNPPASDKREVKFRDSVFREGDRVMQIRNNYDISWRRFSQEGSGIYNGDIGVIEEIIPEESLVRIIFDDRVAEYDFSLLEEIEHAYAITVHKSQGSEYPVVILPLFECAPMLRTRNLFYTAVTRAKNMAILVGRRDVIDGMIENNRHALRYTLLREIIIEEAR